MLEEAVRVSAPQPHHNNSICEPAAWHHRDCSVLFSLSSHSHYGTLRESKKGRALTLSIIQLHDELGDLCSAIVSRGVCANKHPPSSKHNHNASIKTCHPHSSKYNHNASIKTCHLHSSKYNHNASIKTCHQLQPLSNMALGWHKTV